MSSVWTPNDYSNIITIGAAAVGSVLLIVFKSRCKNIKLCCGAVECIREPPPPEESCLARAIKRSAPIGWCPSPSAGSCARVESIVAAVR